MNLQRYSDAFLERTLLPFIPDSVSPNMVSWARIACLPFIFYFLEREEYEVGLGLFAIAALTDALDGAMARVRNQITETGKVLDAVADRGLIALVAIVFLPPIFGWWAVAALGVLEACNGVAAYLSRKKIGMNPGANWAGKIKMILQCAAFALLFIGMFAGRGAWFTSALYLLLTSLFFAVLQIFAYPQTLAAAKDFPSVR